MNPPAAVSVAAGPAGPGPRPLSRLLVESGTGEGERVTLGEIAAGLTDRSFAAMLILLGAPNIIPIIPIIPGSSLVLGVPLIVISSQLVLGRPRVWLPEWLARRSLARAPLARLANRLAPWLRRVERLLRPRWWPQPPVVAERIAGAVALLMSILVAAPIPFGNTIPALAIVVVAISLTVRDGLWLGIGALIATVGLGIVAVFLTAVAVAAGAVIG